MPDTPSRPFLGSVSGRDLDGIRAVAAQGVEIDGAMNIGKPRHDYTPLTLAIENRHVDVVKTLLEVGADPDAVDPMGRRPLQAALITVTLTTVSVVEEVCRALVAGGATVTSDDVERAHDSYSSMGEPMYSREFLAELDSSAPDDPSAPRVIQAAIVRTIADSVEGDWDRVELFNVSVGDVHEVRTRVVRPDGSFDQLPHLPDDVRDSFARLRTAMAHRQTGAWFSCFVTVSRTGDVDFSFERYRRLHADGVWGDFATPRDPSVADAVTDHDYAVDLQRFPRDEPFIPNWYPRP